MSKSDWYYDEEFDKWEKAYFEKLPQLLKEDELVEKLNADVINEWIKLRQKSSPFKMMEFISGGCSVYLEGGPFWFHVMFVDNWNQHLDNSGIYKQLNEQYKQLLLEMKDKVETSLKELETV